MKYFDIYVVNIIGNNIFWLKINCSLGLHFVQLVWLHHSFQFLLHFIFVLDQALSDSFGVKL